MPERIRTATQYPEISRTFETAPETSTIPQTMTRITVVRIAVARFESIPLTPFFARIAVSAANTAERTA